MEHLRQLGRYRIAEVIGASALATVYKAFDPEPERTIALKILRKEGLDPRITAHAVAKFKNQVLAAERLALNLRLTILRHLDTLSADYHEGTPVGVSMYPLKEPIDEI